MARPAPPRAARTRLAPPARGGGVISTLAPLGAPGGLAVQLWIAPQRPRP